MPRLAKFTRAKCLGNIVLVVCTVRQKKLVAYWFCLILIWLGGI